MQWVHECMHAPGGRLWAGRPNNVDLLRQPLPCTPHATRHTPRTPRAPPQKPKCSAQPRRRWRACCWPPRCAGRLWRWCSGGAGTTATRTWPLGCWGRTRRQRRCSRCVGRAWSRCHSLREGLKPVCATWCSLQDEAAGLWLTSLVQSNKLGGLLCATGPSLFRLVTGAPFFPGQADTGLSLAMTRRWLGSASTTASTRSHSRTRQAHTATSSTPGV